MASTTTSLTPRATVITQTSTSHQPRFQASAPHQRDVTKDPPPPSKSGQACVCRYEVLSLSGIPSRAGRRTPLIKGCASLPIRGPVEDGVVVMNGPKGDRRIGENDAVDMSAYLHAVACKTCDITQRSHRRTMGKTRRKRSWSQPFPGSQRIARRNGPRDIENDVEAVPATRFEQPRVPVRIAACSDALKPGSP